jgi:hypothetical protein
VTSDAPPKRWVFVESYAPSTRKLENSLDCCRLVLLVLIVEIFQ